MCLIKIMQRGESDELLGKKNETNKQKSIFSDLDRFLKQSFI
jgi:hypothetical protein